MNGKKNGNGRSNGGNRGGKVSNRSGKQMNNRGGRRPPFNKRDGYGKRSREEDAMMEGADIDAKYSRSNPVEFYTKTGAYAQDAAKLPFARPTGTMFDMHWTGYPTKVSHVSVPGICALYFAPTIGVSHDSTSPINRASIRFYTRLRSQQKVSTDYDHQDITMMELAVDSACMFYSLVKRAIGLLDDWTPVNEYYPNALLLQSGFSSVATRREVQQLRGWLNSYAYSLGQYVIPADLSLIKRHLWMCEGIYTDSTGSRAQTYMWIPTGFWQYDNTVETGSQLVWKEWADPSKPYNVHTIEEVMQFGDALIEALSNDNDFAQIGGDLYRYYGGKTLDLPYVEENYKILPQYDETVLSQIENAVIAGKWGEGYTPVITQNPNVNAGAIIFEPIMAFGHGGPTDNQMNFHWEQPTSDQVLEASRLMVTFEESTNQATVALRSCGTEILQWMVVVNRAYDPSNPNVVGNYRFKLAERAVDVSANKFAELVQNLKRVCQLEKFDWAPRIVFTQQENEGAPVADPYVGDTWDTDVFDTIPNYYMDQINRACLFSLFDVGVEE